MNAFWRSRRPYGTSECYLLTRSVVVTEIITGKKYDYKIEALKLPAKHCNGAHVLP